MSLTISFDNQNETCSPGQEIQGFVNLNLLKETHVTSVIVCFTGVGVLMGDGKKDNMKQEIYFDHVEYLFNSNGTDNEKKEMEGRLHCFPFRYTLPQNIPASFESPSGFVRYSITSYVEDSELGLQTALALFTVNAVLDLNKIPKCQQPRTDWTQQDVCLMCFKCAPVSAVLSVPRRGFVPGEHILITAEINNLNNRPISYVKVTLVQVIKYYHKTGTKKVKRAVSEVVRGSIMPRQSQVWREESLQIPAVVASRLAHCNLMDIWYNLYLHVCSSGLAVGESLKLLKVPIIIGTVPILQQGGNLDDSSHQCFSKHEANNAGLFNLFNIVPVCSATCEPLRMTVVLPEH